MAIKNGFPEHHTEDCKIEYKYTDKAKSWHAGTPPYKAYWCESHGQWCYEYPIKVTWEFEDGSTLITNRKVKDEPSTKT